MGTKLTLLGSKVVHSAINKQAWAIANSGLCSGWVRQELYRYAAELQFASGVRSSELALCEAIRAVTFEQLLQAWRDRPEDAPEVGTIRMPAGWQRPVGDLS